MLLLYISYVGEVIRATSFQLSRYQYPKMLNEAELVKLNAHRVSCIDSIFSTLVYSITVAPSPVHENYMK